MQLKSEELRPWEEIFKHLNEDFKSRKIDDFYLSLRKFKAKNDGNICVTEVKKVNRIEIVINSTLPK